MQAGGRGVVMGRNVWAHPSPDKVIQALNTIIHEGGSVDQAMAFME